MKIILRSEPSWPLMRNVQQNLHSLVLTYFKVAVLQQHYPNFCDLGAFDCWANFWIFSLFYGSGRNKIKLKLTLDVLMERIIFTSKSLGKDEDLTVKLKLAKLWKHTPRIRLKRLSFESKKAVRGKLKLLGNVVGIKRSKLAGDFP